MSVSSGLVLAAFLATASEADASACDRLFERLASLGDNTPPPFDQRPEFAPWAEVTASFTDDEEDFVPSFPQVDAPWGKSVDDPSRLATQSEWCSHAAASAFEVQGAQVWFTVGRAPEACTEDPWMVWREGAHEPVRKRLHGLFDSNVEALWCTERYIVFALEAVYEYGAMREGVAFWDQESGRIERIEAITKGGVDFETKKEIPNPTAGLGVLLRDIQSAMIRGNGDAVDVKTGSTVLTFWPRRREWAQHSRATPDKPLQQTAPKDSSLTGAE